jgi:hypothetical protein
MHGIIYTRLAVVGNLIGVAIFNIEPFSPRAYQVAVRSDIDKSALQVLGGKVRSSNCIGLLRFIHGISPLSGLGRILIRRNPFHLMRDSS